MKLGRKNLFISIYFIMTMICQKVFHDWSDSKAICNSY